MNRFTLQRRRHYLAVAMLATASTASFSATTDSEGMLLVDRFSDDDLSAWTVVDEGNLNGPSAWNKISGRLTQRSNIWGGSNERKTLAKPGSYLLFDHGADWRDYTVKMRFRSDDDDALGVMFRVRGDDYYRFSWDRSRQYRRLVKYVEGEFSLLAEDQEGYEQQRDYVLEISALASSLTVKVDGDTVFEVEDESLPVGSIALYTWSNRATFFDDLSVRAQDASRVADAEPAQLAIVDNSDVLEDLKLPSLREGSGHPLPGNLATWNAFTGLSPTSNTTPAPNGTLDQLARVLLVAKLTGVGQAADYAAMHVFDVAFSPPALRRPRNAPNFAIPPVAAH